VTQAARSLGQIGRIEAGPALIETINRSLPLARATGSTEPSANQESHACCAAISAAAQLGYQPALPIIKPLIPKGIPRSTPVRAVSAWAFGVLGEPDANTCAQLLSCYADPYEAINVKFECLKALGNLPYPAALPTLKGIKDNEKYNPLRWMAHHAYNRIANTDTPYEPLPAVWSADVSRVDLPSR
jgi:HEAT repeat protein